MLEILIAIITFSFLIILHELGHFILAKKFGVKVEEFGLGLPPRLFGKKIGETIFSLNLIPFGGFVRMYGEEKDIKSPQSFTGKPVWQRALIIVAGVAAFWIIAAVLLSIVSGIGAPMVVDDEENEGLVEPRVQIVAVAPGSPAAMAELKTGDTIRKFSIFNFQFPIYKVKELQNLTEKYKGKEVILTIERGREVFDVSLVPRVEPPKDEGAMGVALARIAIKTYSWYEAPIQGILATGFVTKAIVQSWGRILKLVITREPLPPGVKVMGPIGIFDFMGKQIQMGIVYFLHFIAVISIFLALFNILPIPALDGGKLLFLGIEAGRGKPISQKIEQNITGIFFFLLIALIIFVTIKDVARLF